MKWKTGAVLLAVLWCSGFGAAAGPEAEEAGATGAEAGVKQAEGGKRAKKRAAMKAAERLYFRALRERDGAKRAVLVREARTALEKEARDHGDLRAHLLLGMLAELGGEPRDHIRAARHYRIAADGGLPEAKIALAQFWLRNRMFPEEAARQITSIPDYKHNPSALCVLGEIYYTFFEHEKGFRALKRAFALAGREPRLRARVLKIIHQAFDAYLKTGNYAAACGELERERELNPKNALVPYSMGLVELRRGRTAEAENRFNEALELNPALPFVYRELAFLKMRSGRGAEAVDDMKVAYAVSGKKAVYLRELAEICLRAGRRDEAVRIITSVLARHPERNEWRMLRASFLLLGKDYSRALADLRLLKKDPKLGKTRLTLEELAAAASYLGEFAEAEEAYHEIMKLEPGFDAVTALNLAELYIIDGKYAEALKLLGHAGFKSAGDVFIRCIAAYLEASALLASGRTAAPERIKAFYALLPAYKAAQNASNTWDVELFNAWLKKAKLSAAARQAIGEMTAAVAAKKPEKAGVKPPAPPGTAAPGETPDKNDRVE